jgi:hypothetical protein
LAGVDVSWCVTAGWAVDLFVGHQTREHEDLEISIPAASWPRVSRELSTLDFVVAGDGQLWPVTDANLDAHFQTWGRDASGVFRLDVFRDPHDGDTWICRREARLTRPYSALIRHTRDGIPFMAPDVVLLFKAKHDRDKDRADRDVCLPLMSAGEREWLAAAIEMVYPGHPWLTTLRWVERATAGLVYSGRWRSRRSLATWPVAFTL